MKFVKGVMIGGLITTGLMMMYAESDVMNKKKLMKKGKQLLNLLKGLQKKCLSRLLSAEAFQILKI